VLSSVAAAVAVGACADLAPIQPDVCGNGVVEPDNGEDCDDPHDKSCGAPGTPEACRYKCTPGGDPQCPTGKGYGCGVDGICRAPQGSKATFETLQLQGVPTTLDLAAGDTNGDHCADLVYTTVHGTTVTSAGSHAPGLCAASSQTLTSHPLPPSEAPYAAPFLAASPSGAGQDLVVPRVGLLVGDAAQGAASTQIGGLAVYSADTSSSLIPTFYTTETIPSGGVRMLTVKVGAAGQKLLLFEGSAIPVDDGQDGGMTSPPCPAVMGDGGMMMMPDGGPPPDGGMMMMPDGGPPPDGGMMMMPDGGTCPPPPDGGMMGPPPDGGMCPPPPDGGPPPPPPGPGPDPNPDQISVAVVDVPSHQSRSLRVLDGVDLKNIAAIRAGDLDGDGCDEVALAYAGDDAVQLYRVCNADGSLGFSSFTTASVKLDSGSIRSQNASILLVDVDDDGHTDLVVNATDCNIHVAYGDGQGHFYPGHPLAGPDGTTGVLTGLDSNLATMAIQPNSILVAGKFDPTVPGTQIASVECPPETQYVSDVCAPTSAHCEAVVADIDKDGLDDFVATQGQQLGLIVSRAYAQGHGFHVSTLDTTCPPHDLATGDFDDDGVNDIAFLDQIGTSSTDADAGDAGDAGTAVHAQTVLKIAYGNAFARPDAPVASGVLPLGTGLVSGQFQPAVTGPMFPSNQLYAARTFDADAGSGIVPLVGNSDRQTIGPLYIPDVITSPDGTAALANLSIVAAAPGRFTSDGPGLAVMTSDAVGGKLELWLIHAGTSGPVTPIPSVPGTMLACTTCVLVAAPTSDDTDELLVFEGSSLRVYAAGAGGFAENTAARRTTTHAFRSYDIANPPKYVPRPIVGKIDPQSKARADVVLRANDGALVPFWGNGDGTFEEGVLFPAPKCGGPCQAGQAVAQIGLYPGDAKQLVRVGPGLLEFYVMNGRKPSRITVDVRDANAVPTTGTDYTAVQAADFDGDGVDDLAVMTSGTSIHVLRGIPEHEQQ
jgi:hypothetical protein